ncbi:MAG: hypothetical protein ACM3Y9_15910 [Ignavibacteria bacterium]
MIPRVAERLFGRSVAIAAAMPRPAAPAGIPTPTAAPKPGVLVQREEILDGRSRISGYRFRAVALEAGTPATVAGRAAALRDDNLAAFAQRRLAIIPLKAEEWQSGEFRPFVTSNTIFEVEVPSPGGDVAAWQQCVRDMKADGARVGFDSVVATPRLAVALELADAIFVKPDDYSQEGLARAMTGLRERDPAPTIVVDGIHTWDDFRSCVAMGAEYCLGSFAAESA